MTNVRPREALGLVERGAEARAIGFEMRWITIGDGLNSMPISHRSSSCLRGQIELEDVIAAEDLDERPPLPRASSMASMSCGEMEDGRAIDLGNDVADLHARLLWPECPRVSSPTWGWTAGKTPV